MTCQLTAPRRRGALTALLAMLLASPALAQRGPGAADSALVTRILFAEDRRDPANPALRDGIANPDPRIHMLAARARSRIRDPKFAGRDSFPSAVAPPTYSDPAWRLRYRALATTKSNCTALRAALDDTVWAVRLRAADLAGTECAGDSALVAVFRRWVANAPATAVRSRGGVAWQAAAHGIVALTRISPLGAEPLLPALAESNVPWLRTYAARAAGALDDTAALRRLAHDRNANVQEAAIDALAKTAGHTGDDDYMAALSSPGYQAVRAAARALKGSPRAAELIGPLIATARRLRRDSSETSRDTRIAVLERIDEFATPNDLATLTELAFDFDCEVAQAAATIATRLADGKLISPICSPLPIKLPSEAASLALGRTVLLRVTLADSSGGGSFTVRLRGDVAPIMAGRVLELVRSGYYDGLVWHRIEPDFVLQGGGLGANEYVGNPRFIRDELGTVPHVRGTVGMSTRGHDTGDGQWFVNLRDNLRLDPDYTVFGEVVDGIDIVDGVLEGDVIDRIEVVVSP
jgi:cyclophilin family peptidyl-prolyl cis-trans isomerase